MKRRRLLSYLQHLSINTKVVLAYVAFVLIIGAAGTLLVVHNEKSILQEEHVALAQNVAENVAPMLVVEHRMMLNRLVNIVGRLSNVKDCAILNARGIALAHTDMAMIGREIPVGPEARNAYAQMGYYSFKLNAQNIRAVYAPAQNQGGYIGTVVVTFEPLTLMGLFENPRRTTLKNIFRVVLFGAILGLAGAFVITRLISYPVRMLADKTYSVLRGRYPEKKVPINYVYCWEELNCQQEGCPSYMNKSEKCWAVAGTFCKGEVQGVFAQKIGDCRDCVVYRKNSGDDLERLNDGFDIMVRELLDKSERMKEAKESVEKTAAELDVANRQNLEIRIYHERILDSLSSAVISLDEKLIIRKFNRAAQNILGAEVDRLLGKDITEVQKVCTRCNAFFSLILQAIEKYQEVGAPVLEQEVTVKKHDGDLMTLNLSVLPLHGDVAQGPAPIIVVFDDVTEKEKMREELNLSRNLAQLGEVAAKVAHDVRNPLNAIEGGIHYLIGKYQSDSEILNISNLIRGQVERLNSVTQDLLRVSKPMVPNFTECDFNRLVDESASFLEEEVRVAGQTLEKDFGTELPRVSLDFNQFQRVIINLVENAIEATPAGGTITLRTRIGEGGDGRRASVQLAVLDTGSGIPDENLESITKPFYTTKLNGTGLGLSIVRQIVAQHQGELRILKREPGPGTEFVVRLPVKTALKDKTHA